MIELDIDYLISSSNKNLQGIPGFSFIIAKRNELEKCKNNQKSVSLDLYDQWNYLEKNNGGFRFTSPVHAIKAFNQALVELEFEGGILERFKRYNKLKSILVEGMINMNFKPLDLKGYAGPIITTFHEPKCPKFNFLNFYNLLKEKKCVIYPG
jgi:2-aminoethylphosphonate-pyruvate transaminase